MSTNTSFSNTCVPDIFGPGTSDTIKYYVLPVSFRGEMYHLRAAMAVNPLPLILVEYTTAAKEDRNVKQLVDYLTSLAIKSGQDVFLTPWTADELTALTAYKPLPKDKAEGCLLWHARTMNRFETPKNFTARLVIQEKEFNATEYIKHNVSNMATITNAMAEIDLKDHTAMLDRLFAENEQNPDTAIFPQPPADNSVQRVLVLHRDSGKSGVYPEYDTGEALIELLTMLESITDKGVPNNRLKAVICGDVRSMEEWPSTGPYWHKLKNLSFDPEKNGVPQRAFEAYFFQWAYRTGRFSMAVGFRSGALDLFTFLGVPTVSIAVQYGVGEIRHAMLALPAQLKRLNVQYDLPRHKATAWRKYRGPRATTLPALLKDCFESPYWKSEPPLDVVSTGVARKTAIQLSKEEMREMLEVAPSGFHAFDRRTVDLGLRVACSKFLMWPAMVVRSFGQGQYEGIITATDLRLSVPSDFMMRDKFRAAVKKEDLAELELRKTMMKNLQETEQVYEYYFSLYKGW